LAVFTKFPGKESCYGRLRGKGVNEYIYVL